MILRSLQIDHFGIWNGLKIGHLESGVNLFYGPNEVGKTTLMQFVRAIFYGFNSSRLAYGKPENPGACGGSLLFTGENGTFRLRRHVVEYPTGTDSVTLNPELPFYQQDVFLDRYRTQKWEDGLEIFNEAGIQETPFVLKKELGMTASLEADERRFSSIFAIGLQELQQLSVLEATEAASRLYHLSTGLERHTFQALCQELEEERRILLRPEDAMARLRTEEIPFLRDVEGFCSQMLAGPQTRAEQGWILQRLQNREILLHELENIRLQQKGYRQRKLEKETLRGELEELDSQLKQQEHQLHVLVVAQSLHDVWFQRVEAEEMLVKFSEGLSPEECSEDGLEKLREAYHLLRKNEARREELKTERERLLRKKRQLQEEFKKQTISSTFWRVIPQMESLLQQEEWVETLRHRREEKKRAIRDTEAQLAVDHRRLGLGEPDFSAEEPILQPDVHRIRSLRSPVQEVRQLLRKIRKERLRKREFLQQAEERELRIQHYMDSLPSRLGNLASEEKKIPGLPKEPSRQETFQEPSQVATFLGEIASKLRRQELNLQHLIQSLAAE
ncbi:MAG: AAA family ATPase, partial [Planctomycetia bacterium]|nr:AAA family ATPase [Planctomycetia bacterium]